MDFLNIDLVYTDIPISEAIISTIIITFIIITIKYRDRSPFNVIWLLLKSIFFYASISYLSKNIKNWFTKK